MRGSRRKVRRMLFRLLGWPVAAMLFPLRFANPVFVRRIPNAVVRRCAVEAMNFELRRFPKDYVCTSPDGLRYSGNTRDVIQRYIYLFGVWEPDLSAWLRRHLTPGSTVIDVGANIGYYSMLAASTVGPDGKVIAIECLPSIAQSLRTNLELNGLNNIAVQAVAVGETGGSIDVYRAPEGNLGQSSTKAGAYEATVQMKSLDEIVEKHAEQISFIKIDVEGDELRVLRGARRTLEALPRGAAILVEVTPAMLAARGDDTGRLAEILPPDAFEAFVIDNDYSAGRYASPRVRLPRPWSGAVAEQADLLFVKK